MTMKGDSRDEDHVNSTHGKNGKARQLSQRGALKTEAAMKRGKHDLDSGLA